MLLRIYTNTQPKKKIAGKKAAIFTPSEPDFDIIIIWKLTYSYTHTLSLIWHNVNFFLLL